MVLGFYRFDPMIVTHTAFTIVQNVLDKDYKDHFQRRQLETRTDS